MQLLLQGGIFLERVYGYYLAVTIVAAMRASYVRRGYFLALFTLIEFWGSPAICSSSHAGFH